ncbi:MAG: hypothetical protein ACOYXB_00070 [Bacteroidota bacterium]
MKTRYLKKFGAFILLGILAASCATFEDYESLDLPDAPTVTLQLVTAADSSITVSLSTSMEGYIGICILEGTGNAVPDSGNLLTGNLNYIDFVSRKLAANTAESITLGQDMIEQDMSYEVMAVAANSDGVVSAVTVLEVQTSDTHAPNPIGSDPESSFDQVYTPGDPVEIFFDEWVVVDPEKEFLFETYFTGLTFGADSAVSTGYSILVYPSELVPNGDYFQLSYEEGVVSDMSGNPVAALSSSLDDAVGFFWRAVKVVMDAEVGPAGESQPADFTVTLTFGDFVDFSSAYTTGDVAFVYYTETGENKIYVPDGNISISDNVVTITQPFVAASGTVVELSVPQGAFSVGVYNPSGEISANWTIQ